MSDSRVTAVLTKVLCSHGGRLQKDLLSGFMKLPSKKIEQILKDDPEKFTVVQGQVLARSPVRICVKYLKSEAEEECEKLHLCRYYLRGKCRRPQCTFSHDISSDHNRRVLKANAIGRLNEDEIKVLLLQNDNQLLPKVCVKYIHEACDSDMDCPWLHICGYFTRGQCYRFTCKFSHNLLELSSDLLLTRHGMSQESIHNFQLLCKAKHHENLAEIRRKKYEEKREDQEKKQPAAQKGRGRGNRKKGAARDGTESKSQGPQYERAGFQSLGRSGSRAVLESHLCLSGDNNDDDDDDGSGEAQET